jgi:hypothetical protein
MTNTRIPGGGDAAAARKVIVASRKGDLSEKDPRLPDLYPLAVLWSK